MHMNNPPKVAVHAWQPATYAPMQRVHLDFAGPFLDKMFLVMVDSFSKWPEVHVMKDITARSTISKCQQIFAAYGIPSIIVTDNGRTFTSVEFKEFLESQSIIYKLTSPYNPATNGQVERFVQTFKQALKRTNCNSLNLNVVLSKTLLQYRITPHATTNKSPAEMFLNRKLRTRLDLIRLDKQIENAASDLQACNKEFICGERVACRNYTKDSKWKFGTIAKRIVKLHYNIALDDGRSWKRHVNQMRSIGKDTPIVNDDNTYYWCSVVSANTFDAVVSYQSLFNIGQYI
ncbi:PREDICTED: uncharacterized protein K02A2.6-like [Vollenhovia emeryi]|uniref:uncharacterized protein K02A2.6-like n=1 Tax=Vollenhovia emeryi TaxID=411798 RepID=UPI0005F44E61|nr:PREDICTED: uncharacterized protein K02A2.6-like [Vollenhovia emeryi]